MVVLNPAKGAAYVGPWTVGRVAVLGAANLNICAIHGRFSIRQCRATDSALTSRSTDNRQPRLFPLSPNSFTTPGSVAFTDALDPSGKESTMITGTVKFFNETKGYGFIAPEDGGDDAFVHISAVERAGMRTLHKDQRVSYELETDRRGKTSAVNLQSA
jgi:CspA family cold shock protein